jgi:HPt (histidine-containing phosphotransfer) domain-containing protein
MSNPSTQGTWPDVSALVTGFEARYRAAVASDLAALMGADPVADRARIQKIAHAQAGLAATFGADAVGEAALALDQALLDDRDCTPGLMEALTSALAAYLAHP